MIGIVAGIRPGANGYAVVRIEPHLADLTSVDAAATTPQGLVSVSYRKTTSGMVNAIVTKPAGLQGQLVWHGKSYPLTDKRSELPLPQ